MQHSQVVERRGQPVIVSVRFPRHFQATFISCPGILDAVQLLTKQGKGKIGFETIRCRVNRLAIRCLGLVKAELDCQKLRLKPSGKL
jgi:hypothetical protein